MSTPFLREAVNVPDFLARERLVKPLRKLHAMAMLEKSTIEHWNRTHANDEPIDTTWCDEIIAWCDGTGPIPAFIAEREP